MNIVKHVVLMIAGVFIILGIPFFLTDYGKSVLSGDIVDASSSATTIIDAPSGDFIILINKEYHNGDNLSDWITYFTGGDIAYIFDDITVTVAASDPSAVEMTDSFRSKLPENQMRIVSDNSALVLSRADKGAFDMMIMSTEFAENNGAESAFTENVEVIRIKGETE